MGEAPKGSWWATLPGVLTALAGVITALTALLTALQQAGVFAILRPPPAQQAAPAPQRPAAVPATPAPGAGEARAQAPQALLADPLEAWRMPDGGIGLRLRLRNAGGGALLVEPARDLRLVGADGAVLAPRRAAPVFHTLAAGDMLEASLEFPPAAGQPTLRLGERGLALPPIR